MSNVRMVFSSDLQIASDEVIKEICLDINTRVVIIASYHAIDERWRRAILVAGNGCSVAVVRGSAKEKDKAVRSDAKIILVSSGGAGRILDNKELKADILILDELEELISIREEFKNNISNLSHNTAQTIGISRSLNRNNLRHIPEILRIIGMEDIKRMLPCGFYERYYFREYLKKDKGTICRLEPKPGAVEAVKRFLREILDLQLMDEKKTADTTPPGFEEYIPLDYKEKSRYGFIKTLKEEKAHGYSSGYYDGQYV